MPCPSALLRHAVGVAVLLGLALLAGACATRALEFSIGECVNLPDGTEITEFSAVDCAEAHDAEVYALPQHPAVEGAPFPGTEVLEMFADERCKQDFESYVGVAYDDSETYSTALHPSAEAWTDADDREIVCLLVGEPLTGAGEAPRFEQLVGSQRGANE